MIPKRWTKNGWTYRRLACLLMLSALAILLTRAGWAMMGYSAWTQDANGYVLLVPLIVAWQVYARRMRFNFATPRFDWVGMPAIALGAGLYLSWIGDGEPQLAGTLGTALIFGGTVATVMGRNLVAKFGAAWFALLFLNPIPGGSSSR